MVFDVDEVVGPDGWTTASELLTRISRRTLQRWLSAGRLVRLRPGVYAAPGAASDWRVRAAAAVAGRKAVLSHATALALWNLAPHPSGPVHVTVDENGSARGSDRVVVHRASGAWDDRRRVDGLPVVSVERAVVESWGLRGGSTPGDVRAAAITAVRRRLCSPRELGYELQRSTRLRGRAALVSLVDLLADGCQSELEIWGCLRLLRGQGMPGFVRQRRVVVRGEVFFLDAACEEAMLAVELDGAAWHGSQTQRERDIRRDALLATVGWQTLRFGYRRIMQATEHCQAEIIAVAASRRRLLRGDVVR
ncbi:type IV toxin-antitoxin system AbiEi family antitoxin domain-containing protein [Geodermatophilus sp. YIM 151500]|uniref:type IV toxin-antitoxin system AbiEi family antitoxin domain-containing protein n=1 Tax=Geodermatophilus sp. YIM 151500 TaxID=2984531 RepID=UPI0021E474C1|nr:type IV toxin-antitoxin system AbiEi family antitoxin domain-containing protein [Geodermatophilus sp. YIM 151500]MCV2491654.1 type IV toxin-antitoxin system AbiEi family antitoxin domain-containing protein [Geodermatophilus sp. YIM 151500]